MKLTNMMRLFGKTGIPLIDNLLNDTNPLPTSIMVIGPAGTGKSLLCQQFVGEAIKQEQGVVYVILDDFADNIRKHISKLISNIKTCERLGKLTFLDGYSFQFGLTSKEKYGSNINNLLELNFEIEKSIKEMDASTVVIDSLTTLILTHGFETSIKFFWALISKIRQRKVNCFIKLNSRAFPLTTIESLLEITDGVIETKREHTRTNRYKDNQHYIRILKFKGIKHKKAWTPYEIDPKLGLLEKDEEHP